jgi:hypothetical protein
MQHIHLRTGSLIFLLTLLGTSSVRAGERQNQELENQLRQRDQVILELLDRVKALEREVGVRPAKSKKSSGPEQGSQVNSPTPTDQQARAPGLVIADESMAERALERSLTRAGALLLSPGVFELEPRLTYSRQEDTSPGFVISGSSVIASQTELNSDSISASMILRYGLPSDAQLEIGLPYQWRKTETVTNVNFAPINASTQSGSGAGDVRVTLAKTLLRGESQQASVIGRLTWDTDSGKSSANGVSLGGGYNDVQGALTFIKRQDPVVFLGGLSYQRSFEKDTVQPGAIVSASFGSYLALNPQTSMSFSLNMAYQQETRFAGNPLAGSDRTIGTFCIGGSTLISRATLLNLSIGIGLTRDASDFSVTASLPMRF